MELQHPWARKASNMSHLKTRNVQKVIKKLLKLTKSNKYINHLKPLGSILIEFCCSSVTWLWKLPLNNPTKNWHVPIPIYSP